MIKRVIFRTPEFILKILTIIDELNLSELMKRRIPNRGKDKRYGREVIYELNKNYPVIMISTLSKEELKKEVVKALNHYGIQIKEI